KAIDNQEGSLKEYTIATEVFGRSNNYDSRSDSVVRVQAGRLRSKLQEYYSTEGKDDRVIIELPKGHYTPAFSTGQTTNGKSDINDDALQPPVRAVEGRRGEHRRLIAALVAFGLISIVLLAMVVNYRWETQSLKASLTSHAAGPANQHLIEPLWGDFLRSQEPTLVSFSNTLFQGTAETGMRLLKPLDSNEENTGSVLSFEGLNAAKVDGQAVTEHYTGIGEVMGIYHLGDFFYSTGKSIRVKRSLLVTWDDLKSDNIVVLGSPAENFLLRNLPQEQDFVFRIVKDEKQNPAYGIVNTKPRPGEQEVYLAKQEGPSRSQISEDYALVSFLRGLDSKNRLMILAGITTFGTQAAAEYVTKPEYIEELISKLNTAKTGPPKLPPFYQILVKVQVKGGVPVRISYVTHHEL
ncbi:MAG TPA: hypothetical protein VFQ92_18550, partial [Blastocatellia bacterium]|nr:hypothetical protein [Blastocatellia bacterium]